jgi:adenylate kinase
VINIPPAVEGVCDACGGELYQRKDDNEETIANRLDVYNRQTESLISRYEEKGLLVSLDSDQGVASLMAEIDAKLQSDADA